MATKTAPTGTIRENFGLLPEPKGRFGSFSISLGANLLLSLLFLWIAITQLQKPPANRRYESTTLVFANPPPPPPPVTPLPKITVTAPPVLVEQPRKIEMPRRLPEPPKPETVRLNTPAMPTIPAAPPKAVVAPPQPKVGLFAWPKPTAVANNLAAPSVQTGGFGNPSGVVVNPNAGRQQTIAAVGAFNAAPGANQGAGAARAGVVQGTGFGSGVANGVPGGTSRGTVASAGFANGVVGGTAGGTGSDRGGVATAGFGSAASPPSAAAAAKASAVTFVAPEVISEPRPQYTEEARQLKIQGEVTLQVKFGADGRVEVLRVVDHLGHGLDEQAERVAQQIHFKPAAKNGLPVDHITYIHILFQLA